MTKMQRNLVIGLMLYFGLLTTLEAFRPQEENTLRFVSVLFRHGDRTVDTANNESFPTDPYKTFNYYPDGSGQLTNAGKKRVYEIGLMLKNRYKKFLGLLYYPPNVYIRCTMIPRTKTSAQIVHAALFSPTGEQKWNLVLPWQPADINYIHDAQDMLLFPILCPVYNRLYQEMLQTPEIKKQLAEFANLREKLSICTGKNINTMYDCFLVYGTLLAQKHYGIPTLPCVQEMFPNGKLLDAVNFQMKLFSYGLLNKINGGILLRRIINDMEQKKNGTLKDRRINLYSGHDFNLAALLQALNIYNNEIPKYGSCIMIELHEMNNEYFVKVLYYLGIPTRIEEKVIPGCEVLCPYNKFVQLLSATTATNEESQCPEKMNLSFKMTKMQHSLGIVLMLCFGLLTTLEAILIRGEESLQDDTLRFVNAVFRHGDHTADTANNESFPNDPYKTFDYYPDGIGQLTDLGKKRVYALGVMLELRYSNFLGSYYYPPNVYTRCTMIPRTKTSAQIIHAALFLPIDKQKWNVVLPWQPTDINYMHDAQDMLLFPIRCPVYYRLYQEMLQTPEIKAKVAEFDDLRKKLSICTGKNITSIYDCFLVYNTLLAQKHYNLSTLPCTEDIFPNGKLLDAVIFQMKLFSYGPLNKLNGGILLRRIINDMKQKINGTLPDRKINLFSAHDLNVAALLQALNIYNNETPKYGSCIIIELHEKNNEYFVKVLYYLGIPSKTEEKVIPGCEVLCPYNKFVELLSETTATNEESQCLGKMNLNLKF
ncbi:uncharacterized protein LOC114936176 [Nylanderia fulva]|uniref:uncharacterized protein LOC114936176 n=1 Tax=Nylanderia fulva TaxID=613905 RepID=UPI0010FB7FC2|nr:uncharacterized protein LOC114936176 [Nylanderia fulva]